MALPSFTFTPRGGRLDRITCITSPMPHRPPRPHLFAHAADSRTAICPLPTIGYSSAAPFRPAVMARILALPEWRAGALSVTVVAPIGQRSPRGRRGHRRGPVASPAPVQWMCPATSDVIPPTLAPSTAPVADACPAPRSDLTPLPLQRRRLQPRAAMLAAIPPPARPDAAPPPTVHRLVPTAMSPWPRHRYATTGLTTHARLPATATPDLVTYWPAPRPRVSSCTLFLNDRACPQAFVPSARLHGRRQGNRETADVDKPNRRRQPVRIIPVGTALQPRPLAESSAVRRAPPSLPICSSASATGHLARPCRALKEPVLDLFQRHSAGVRHSSCPGYQPGDPEFEAAGALRARHRRGGTIPDCRLSLREPRTGIEKNSLPRNEPSSTPGSKRIPRLRPPSCCDCTDLCITTGPCTCGSAQRRTARGAVIGRRRVDRTLCPWRPRGSRFRTAPGDFFTRSSPHMALMASGGAALT